MAEKRIMTIQLLPTGSFEIDYEDKDTVQYLKNRICHVPELEGKDYDSRFIKLLCDGNVLENDQLLKDCEINEDSTFLMIKQKPGKINPQRRKDLSLLSGKGLFDTVWSLDSFNDPFGMSPFSKNRMLESTIKPHTPRNQDPFLEVHGPRQRDPIMSSMSSFRSNDFKGAGTASFGGDFNATNFRANASSTNTLETDFASSLTIKDDEPNPIISMPDPDVLTKIPPPKFPNIESKLPDLTSTFPTMNTNFPTIGTNFPAMGTNFPGMGTDFPAMNTNFPAMGTNFPGMGTNFSAMGTNFPAMGTNFPAMSTNFPAMGTKLPDSLTNLPNTNSPSALPSATSKSKPKGKKKKMMESSVQSLIEMGYTAKQSKKALKLSNNDLSVAIEMLVAGAVPNTEPENPKPMAIQSGRKVKASIIKKATDDQPTSDISSESESELESESETEAPAFNDSNPSISSSQMRDFVQRLRNDPQQLQSVKSTLRTQNPQLAQMIDANPEQFFNLLEHYGPSDNNFTARNSGFGGSASGFGASATGFGGGASGFGTGASGFGDDHRSGFGNDFTSRESSGRGAEGNQQFSAPGEVSLTPSQNEKISNIAAMGFDRQKVIEAFMLCDRNEDMTISYLLSLTT